MGYELHISLRHLRARGKEAFLSLIAFLSAGGIALGVATLIVVTAVWNGFEGDLKRRILAVSSHAWIARRDGAVSDWPALVARLRAMPEVTDAAPFVHGQGMLRSAKAVTGVLVKGIDPALSGKNSGFAFDGLVLKGQGSLSALAATPGDGGPGIILGKELAATLQSGMGSTVALISPERNRGVQEKLPGMRRFQVVGILETGMYEYDNALAWMHLAEAQKTFGMDAGVSGVEVCVRDVFQSREAAKAIGARLGFPYWTSDWSRTNENLFTALRTEKAVMFIILSLIVLVAAFNIAGTLVMSVLDRHREIAILRTMGATRGGILKVFVYNGMLMGAAGTLAGFLLGAALCYLVSKYQFIRLDPKIYPLATMPVQMRTLDVVAICCGAMLVSFTASLYPAWRASRLAPVEILRNG
jgi:lipoprotein-releasing system permease protein